jgi:hypothetical protein
MADRMKTIRSHATLRRRAAALLTLTVLLLAGAEREALGAMVHRPMDLGVGRRDAARQIVEQHPAVIERRIP